jgi:elongation factor Ts
MSNNPVAASDVKALREMTSCGMMDCKKALEECNGNFDEATDYLRKKGLASVAYREDRSTDEGVVRMATGNGRLAFVKLQCETDFVANCEAVQNLVNDILDMLLDEKMDEVFATQATVLKDNVSAIVREKLKMTEAESINLPNGFYAYTYNHGNSIAGAVTLNSDSEKAQDLGKSLSMQVVSNNPLALNKESMDIDIVEKEAEFIKSEALESGKPTEIVDKMVKGRMDKFYKTHCLIEQPLVTDPDKVVKKILIEESLLIDSIFRSEVGVNDKV